MFTNLSNILRPAAHRIAENTDTHQYIRQHERDQSRRKKGRQEHGKDYDATQDEASVSIDALYTFIINMIEQESAVKGKSSPPSGFAPEQGLSSVTPPAPISPNTRAAGAYAHAAQTMPPSATNLTPQTDAAQDLPKDGDETIRRLLKDIAVLKSRGIQEIHIERGDTFLDSLFQAIEKAKTL